MCSDRAWSSGDLEFIKRDAPDRTGMMRKNEWSKISWYFDDDEGYFDPYKALDPPCGLGRMKSTETEMG